MLGEKVFGRPDGIMATEEWLDKVGMRLRLRDLGFEVEKAGEIAENVVRTASTRLRLNPRTLDAEAIAGIYRESY